VVRIWIFWPSASGSRKSCTAPFDRSRTACSASFGPIARAASSPVAPSGSSSSDSSGRTTFMSEQDTQPREDDRNDELEDSPAPDPTEGESSEQDVPEAD
jgi:hypothetical protein